VGTARRKQLTLVACILGSGIAMIDGTVVNVALPHIQGDLGGGFSSQQWIVNAYTLTLGSLLLVGGSLGDIYGERRIFTLGVAAFGATSLLCSLAPSIDFLIGARALQGAASALLTPSALAVIIATFGPDERGAAIGTWTAWSGIGTVIGPLVGGEIVDTTTWRWIFLINIPFVIVTIALILIAIPAPAGRKSTRRVDVVGAVLCALGLGGPVFALIEQPQLGWGSPAVIIGLVGGVVLLGAFVWWESRVSAPLLELSLFRQRNFSVGNLETLAMYAGLSSTLLFLILFLQNVVGYSALQSGLATLPITFLMLVFSKRFGALSDRFGPRFFMSVGPLVFATGMLLMLRLDETTSYATDVLPAVLVFGLGLAMTVAPLTATVLGGIDQRHAGIGSAVNNAIARIAAMLGVAVVGLLVAMEFTNELAARAPVAARLSPAARQALADAHDRPLGRVDLSAVAPAAATRLADDIAAASTHAFHAAVVASAVLAVLGAGAAAIGIVNPKRHVCAADCPGGALAPATVEATREQARAAAEAA
jgi:EmrB/QacA subfamily drug resistance transporter